MLTTAFLFCFVGLAILVVAGDLLVRGAVNLSLRAGIPALIVSLTIVAFGTSAPELLVSIDAVVSDKPGLALGNVVGSNIANVLLVLGLPALISRLHTGAVATRRSYLMMLAATGGFIALGLAFGFDWRTGLALLAGLALTLFDQFRDARRARRSAAAEPEDEDVEGANPDMPVWRIWAFLILGLAGLPLGAHLLVDNAATIASAFGVSDAVIGLTLVALGTSLPELATTVIAAMRRQADVAIGNVIGSNIFNLLAIIGIASMFGPIPVEAQIARFDFWVMAGAAILLAPFVMGGRDLTRRYGAILCLAYVAYVTLVVI